MILQFDDIVLQVSDRLKAVIPTIAAKIEPMRNAQEDIEKFFQSKEQSKIMVCYSGGNAEGGRQVSDFQHTLGDITQRMAHTIEVHVCARKFLNDNLAEEGTLLRLLWAVRASLVGLHMYWRDNDGVVLLGDPMQIASDSGLFWIETIIDRERQGGVYAVARFQIMETVSSNPDLAPETIWGTYQEITLEGYSGQVGNTLDNSGEAPTETTTVVTGETEN